MLRASINAIVEVGEVAGFHSDLKEAAVDIIIDIEKIIYNEEGKQMLNGDEIKSYVVMYIPDKIYIDEIAKMGGKKGYIRFYNIEGYDEPIKYSVSPSSMGTHMDHFTIIFNNKRYRFI